MFSIKGFYQWHCQGVAGVGITGPPPPPYSLTWSGPSNGSLSPNWCSGGAVEINNLAVGNYILTVSNSSGPLGTCNFTITSNSIPSGCDVFNNPVCRAAIADILEDEVFGTPPDCQQWEGDPCSHTDNIYRSGNVGIGTSVGKAGYSLAVSGGIVTDKVRIELCESSGWCDYVFDENYPLLPLPDLALYVKEHKHLPGSVAQKEVTENGGFELGSVKTDHQVKIEEAYLHLIALNKKKQDLEQRLDLLTKND